MKLLKTLVATTVLVASSFAVQATPITVGGVTWNPDFNSGFGVKDFSGSLDVAQWWSTVASAMNKIDIANLNGVTGAGNGELMGIATFDKFNGMSSGFVCNTCSLNLAFGGITFGQSGFNIANSWFKVYSSAVTVDPFSAGQYANAQTGSLFLTGKFDYFALTSGNINNGVSEAFLSVDGGLAYSNFNTNGQNNGQSDFKMTGAANFEGSLFAQSASSPITGNSIPEPSSLAVLGLGLLGLAGAARRKSSK